MTEQLFLDCPECNEHSNYGGGSSFHCDHCGRSFQALTEDEIIERAEDWNASSRPYVRCDDAFTASDLADWLAHHDL